MHQFFKFIFAMKLYMFRTVPLSVIRSFSLYTQQWYISYKFADSLRTGSLSCSQAVNKPVWHITLLCVQWKTPDDEQRNCPKHVEFHCKNKFEKSVHLVGLYYKKLITMQGHINDKLKKKNCQNIYLLFIKTNKTPLLDVIYSIVHIWLSATCFVSFRTILRETYTGMCNWT